MTRPVRVGIDASVLCDRGVFGIRSHLSGLVGALSRHGVELHLLHPWTVDGVDAVASAGSARTFRFNLPGLRSRAWEQLVLPLMGAARRVDVLHSPANTGPCVALSPSVITLHDVIQFRPDAAVPPRIARYLRRIVVPALRRAAAVICVSETTRREASDLLGLVPARLHVIPNGVAQTFFEMGVARPPRAPRGLVVAPGSTVPTKNLVTTLRAFTRIAAAWHGARLQLFSVLPGTESRVLALAADAGCAGELELIAPKGDREMAAAIAAADVLLFPSLQEGFGLPIAEAFAAGTPVVTSDRGAMAETAGDAALLVDPSRPDAVADAALTLLANPERAEHLRRLGVRRALAFRWDEVARQTASLYEAVRSRKGALRERRSRRIHPDP